MADAVTMPPLLCDHIPVGHAVVVGVLGIVTDRARVTAPRQAVAVRLLVNDADVLCCVPCARAYLRSLPCSVRCWRVGGPVAQTPGKPCPECGTVEPLTAQSEAPDPASVGAAFGDDAHDPWADLCALRRMAVVGETAMAAGFDAAPFTADAPKLADAAWHRLRRRFDPAA